MVLAETMHGHGEDREGKRVSVGGRQKGRKNGEKRGTQTLDLDERAVGGRKGGKGGEEGRVWLGFE